MKHEFDPYPFLDHFMNTYSKEELEEMHLRWSSVTKYTTAQIRIMAQCFKEKARDLG